MLVLVSLLATLLLQGIGSLTARQADLVRAERAAADRGLRRHWFISTVGAVLPSRLAGRSFEGDGASFEATTLRPLAGESGLPARIRWSLVRLAGGGALVYAEEGVEGAWTVWAPGAGPLAFEYRDGAGRWWARWPVERDGAERIPRFVRLAGASGRTVWLAHLGLHPEPVVNYLEER